MRALANEIRAAILEKSDTTVKEGCERYFRSVLPFHGAKTPTLNAIYKGFLPRIKQLGKAEALQLASDLLCSKFAEEKGMAIRILNTRRNDLDLAFLVDFEPMLRTHVFDWGTADGISGKVFRYLIERGEKQLTTRIVAWRNDPSLWMQRMAAVSFVNLARHGAVTPEVLKVCQATVKNPERFTQLGTGWVLRELWLAEPSSVEQFIEDNVARFSREGLRYAIEKMPKTLQSRFLRLHQTRAESP